MILVVVVVVVVVVGYGDPGFIMIYNDLLYNALYGLRGLNSAKSFHSIH